MTDNCNILLDSPTHSSTARSGYKRTDSYIQWRTEVSNELTKAGLSDVAEQFESCADTPRRMISHQVEVIPAVNGSLHVCSADHTHDAMLFSATCDLRICPDCARRQSARLVARYLPALLQARQSPTRKHRLRHIVLTRDIALTSELAAAELNNGFSSIRNLFDRMLGKDWTSTGGYIATAEFGSSGFKLHYHVVAYVPYMDQAEMSEIWEELTTSKICFIRQIAGTEEKIVSEVQEILKYVTKFWSTDSSTGEPKYIPPELMPVLHRVLKGTRRVRSVGIFYNIPETESEPLRCECGAPMRRISLEDWQHFRQCGYTPYELGVAARQAAYEELLLKLANKSPGDSGKTRGSPDQIRLL